MSACRNQYLCSLILSIPSFMASFGLVWPSYAIPILESDYTPLTHKISKHDGDLIGSFPMLGSFLATLYIGALADWIGRKKSKMLCGVSLIIAWAIITNSKTSIQLLIGRFIFGTGFGINFVVALIFTGEMAHPSTTGTATSILLFSYSMGTLGSYLAGWFCSYEVICYINLTLGVIFLVTMSFMKETPAFLIGQRKEKEALQSLRFYRAPSTTPEDIRKEYNYIKSQRINRGADSNLEISEIDAENEKLNKENYNKEYKETRVWKILITSKPSQRELILNSMYVMLTMCMGMMGVQAYAGQFFLMAVPSISPHLCSVVLALVLAIASGVAAGITDMIGRRVLLITSISISSFVLALLGSQLRWSWAPNWIIPLLVVLYCISFQLGANNIPLVQATEIFIPEIRGMGVQLQISFVCISSFIVLLLFGPAVEHLGIDCTFFMFSLIGAIAGIFVFFTMRETRGVPLETIQEMFATGYLYRKN